MRCASPTAFRALCVLQVVWEEAEKVAAEVSKIAEEVVAAEAIIEEVNQLRS